MSIQILPIGEKIYITASDKSKLFIPIIHSSTPEFEMYILSDPECHGDNIKLCDEQGKVKDTWIILLGSKVNPKFGKYYMITSNEKKMENLKIDIEKALQVTVDVAYKKDIDEKKIKKELIIEDEKWKRIGNILMTREDETNLIPNILRSSLKGYKIKVTIQYKDFLVNLSGIISDQIKPNVIKFEPKISLSDETIHLVKNPIQVLKDFNDKVQTCYLSFTYNLEFNLSQSLFNNVLCVHLTK
jgi:hypothetical protein